MTEVTTYYLEMKSASSLKDRNDSHGLQIFECEIKQFQFNRFLYQLVGADWEWIDKLSWTDDQWKAFAENGNLRTWVGYYKGSPAGYYELQQQDGGDVEIAYFGLAPKFIGKGFGSYLLSHAIKSAWDWEGTRRVWVHTCTLDHPTALQNYKARGLEVYKVETDQKD
ncbi:MAG: GNAT family N-acetyltransferase [Desulfobacterales bacterium]|jgi:GNAT superfamily N-acetyltransferase